MNMNKELIKQNKELIKQIVAMEWTMFQNVSNQGGRASCQDDPKTFEIMRSSQWVTWPEEALASYLEDLKIAFQDGRNLVTEKYARMMQSTAPLEFAQFQDQLPPLNQEMIRLIDDIVTIHLFWEEELMTIYPYLCQRGRPVYTSEDTPYATSIETYLRGELGTYSQKTLNLYYQHILKEKAEGINGSKRLLENTVKRYGFSSLEEANENVKLSAMKK
ncbi:DUF4125 family protein [Dehalobacterium formicoaceticum]|uniref:DUF4125 family protein n=1 Tax=Dehalobacterium formicoaceticum TaxID=51515 RepID=UPI0018E0098B|nr:DUF4125 family protein [Dehalobacterium formicoaceticum]